jgi:multiple sugar transport system ATP-binding protein
MSRRSAPRCWSTSRPTQPRVLSEDTRQAVEDEDTFAQMQREARAGGGQLVARFEPSATPAPGEPIDVAFKPGNLHFFDLATGAALR